MALTGNPAKIKRDANRLCHTGIAGDVTRDDHAGMEADEDFVVYEAKTGEDVRRFVLREIIQQRENHG